MDPSDKLRLLQGKTVLRFFKEQLAKQPGVDPNGCLTDAKARYGSYELREQVRNGLATDCNTCQDGVCVQAPYGAPKPPIDPPTPPTPPTPPP